MCATLQAYHEPGHLHTDADAVSGEESTKLVAFQGACPGLHSKTLEICLPASSLLSVALLHNTECHSNLTHLATHNVVGQIFMQ